MNSIGLSEDIAAELANLQHGDDLFVEALADESLAQFRSNVHVITGAMKASGCVITPFGSGYGESVAAAAALNPKADFAPEQPVGAGEAVLQIPISYAAHEEFGTSRRPAHPALVPAVESVVADAESIAKRVYQAQ